MKWVLFLCKKNHREEKDDQESKDTEDQLESRKKSIAVYGAGHLYYLMPAALPAFQQRLTAFLETEEIEAATARVLEDHVDDRSDAESPAVFYLELDDEAGTIVEVSFEKTSGRYGFAIAGPDAVFADAGQGAREEGRMEQSNHCVYSGVQRIGPVNKPEQVRQQSVQDFL